MIDCFILNLPVIFAKYLTNLLFPLPRDPTKQTAFPTCTAKAKFLKFCFVEFTSIKSLSYKMNIKKYIRIIIYNKTINITVNLYLS